MLALVGIHVAMLELTLWMAWDPSILLLPPPYFHRRSPSPSILACWVCTGLWAAFGNACTLACKTQPAWLSGQALGYLFWVCVLGANADSTGPDSCNIYNSSYELSKQSVFIRREQCLNSPLPVLLLLTDNWPVHLAARPNLSLSGGGKHVLLCLASVESYWSWGMGSVSVVPGSRPWACLSSSFKSSWAL